MNKPLTVAQVLSPKRFKYKLHNSHKWVNYKKRTSFPAFTVFKYWTMGENVDTCWNSWAVPVRVVNKYNGFDCFYLVQK